MTAGRGMLHEEMWDAELDTHELYQVTMPISHIIDEVCEVHASWLPTLHIDGVSDWTNHKRRSYSEYSNLSPIQILE